MRRKKPPALSTDPRFYLEWIALHKRIAPSDSVAFAWLAGTMTTEELIAVHVAAEKVGAKVVINRKGAGEVVLPIWQKKEESE